MLTVNPKKAKKYFKKKMSFTTGPAELNSMIQNNEDINIIDVRHREDFEQGHIPGAKNLPKDHWATFKGLSKDKNNIIYCYSVVCHLAADASRKFAEEGFPVIELEGGFAEWQNMQLPVDK